MIVEGVVENEVPTIRVRNKCDVIAHDKLEQLFEKFVRLDDNTTRTNPRHRPWPIYCKGACRSDERRNFACLRR